MDGAKRMTRPTDTAADATPGTSGADGPARESGPQAAIDRLVRRARLAILWERAWPPLAFVLGIVALFFGASWLGLWSVVDPWVRAVLLAAFAALFAVPLVALVRFARPLRTDAIARIEQVSGRPHRPLTAFDDSLADPEADPTTRALWSAHRRRVAAEIASLQAGAPAPKLYRRDPFAIRAVVGLVLFVGLFAGAGHYRERIAAAFAPFASPVAAPPVRLDAWVTPPGYTGRAPVFLTGATAGNGERTVRVPSGSELVVRIQGANDARVTAEDAEGSRVVEPTAPEGAGGKTADAKAGDAKKPADASTATAAAGTPAAMPAERRIALTANGSVTVTREGAQLARWNFVVDRDTPPTIAWAGAPTADKGNALQFNYQVSDDYGVSEAFALVKPIPEPGADGRRPLVDAPEVRLSLPPKPARSGAARTVENLTKHPWAGSRVSVVLVARDEAGQEGRSEPMEVTLPERPFRVPLARAIIEQRRDLALDAEAQLQVIEALDALMIAPDGIFRSPTAYLGTRMVYGKLVAARSDDALKPLLDEMWELALAIEDGSTSLAAQALRDAQDRLRQALQDGASDEEIARLTEELRQAMQRYLSALAEQARRNPQSAQSPPDQDTQMVRPQDLDEMLKRIEELSKTGSKEAAEQLLSQLQEMLENMQMAQPGQNGPGQQGQGSLDALGRMIQEQQKLMDETYRLDRGDGQDGQQGQTGEGQQGQNGSGQDGSGRLQELQRRQDQLSQQLGRMLDELNRQNGGQPGQGQDPGQGQGQGDTPGQGQTGQNQGQTPGQSGNGQSGEGQPGDGRDALGRAGRAMGDAGRSLGNRDTANALDQQGEALDALRRGAQQMAEQMARQNGQQRGNGSGPYAGSEDPLGRSRHSQGPDFGTSVKVPDEIDVQRARRILDELRRRLGELGRSQFELDYLERLLPHD